MTQIKMTERALKISTVIESALQEKLPSEAALYLLSYYEGRIWWSDLSAAKDDVSSVIEYLIERIKYNRIDVSDDLLEEFITKYLELAKPIESSLKKGNVLFIPDNNAVVNH